MKPLAAVLTVQVALGLVLIALVATDNVPFLDGDSDAAPRAAGPSVDRFDSAAAFRLLREQVELGPRPAGSPASRRLAARLRRLLPNGRFQAIPRHPGLRNVVGRVRGRSRRYVVVGAHYDTKDIPGFVGANDGASGTATVVQLARELRGRRPPKTLVFVLFDGEESPGPDDDGDFLRTGLRGSKFAARRYREAEAMVLLDFVGDKNLRIPREDLSNRRLWARLRAASRRVGASRVFPSSSSDAVYDDHVPFLRRGVPSIDLIDFDFPCWHRRCDNMSAVSERSLDRVGETVYELLASL
ncbi:MAG TPA: M28 family metallopeptidase [Thermoleophilaceae bacterium]|nr:M28 family metallopeptidase [Thermoleophilaceae bacterium]